MSDIHHHHDSAIVESEGPSTALIALIVLMLVGFLIWLFAFSGIVFRNAPVNNTNNNSPRIEAPTNNNPGVTNPGGNTQTQPSP